ncbi:hypothetical protein [Enterocloster lavalensis]|uniref:hypothetical protein n=1 Tax=Enterocloster lavalensis TaxID=460384 RepID=UPI0034A49032
MAKEMADAKADAGILTAFMELLRHFYGVPASLAILLNAVGCWHSFRAIVF